MVKSKLGSQLFFEGVYVKFYQSEDCFPSRWIKWTAISVVFYNSRWCSRGSLHWLTTCSFPSRSFTCRRGWRGVGLGCWGRHCSSSWFCWPSTRAWPASQTTGTTHPTCWQATYKEPSLPTGWWVYIACLFFLCVHTSLLLKFYNWTCVCVLFFPGLPHLVHV